MNKLKTSPRAKHNDSATCTQHQTRNQRRNGRQNWCSLFVGCIRAVRCVFSQCSMPLNTCVCGFSILFLRPKKKKMIHTNSHTHTLARALCAFFLLSFVLFVCYWCHIKVIHATRLLIGQFHMHVEQWIKSGIRSAATSSIKRLFQKTLLDYIILFFYLLSIFGRSSFYRFPIFLSWFSFFYPSSFS